MKKVLLIIVMLFAMGCTDAKIASYMAYGETAKIECWSGGKVTYSGESTGAVATINGSDGWQFEDIKTKELVRISGDCIIRY